MSISHNHIACKVFSIQIYCLVLLGVSAIFTIKELADKANVNKSTLNRYVELGVIKPVSIDAENNYRYFDEVAIHNLNLVKTLKVKPFRLKIREIKHVLEDVDASVLDSLLSSSNRDLLNFLIEKKFI